MNERSHTARRTISLLIPGFVALLVWSETAAAQTTGSFRLSDRLESARIDSPLLDIEAAPDLDALEDPYLDVLLDEGFEEFDWDYAGWPRIPGAEIVTEEGGAVLRLEGIRDDATFGWVLPVESDAFYRFERAVRVEGEPFCDLYVVEIERELEGMLPDVRDLFLAGRGEALKTHSLPLRSGAEVRDAWQRTATSFYPTPRTRSLVVVIRPRVGADRGATVQATSFDDVRLEQVYPGRVERMRLLKGAHAAPDADPALGMRKSGLLLPLPSADDARPDDPSERNYTWRQALYAPPTTELAFELAFPRGAHLRLATGLARETPPEAAARFQVELRPKDGGEPELLFDVVRTARREDWHWQEVDLDLTGHAGREGTLLLRTLAEKGDPHPLWASPRVESTGTPSDPLVILIAVDTLRADRLSAYGYEHSSTPNLDRLAAEGVRFDQARSNCNWTCPSFASIFTGLVPSRHGVTSYGPATPLPDELVTLAEHFAMRDWTTRSIAYKVPLFDGNYEQGFDQAFNVPRDFIRGEDNVVHALDWLEEHRGGPAFLFLHFNDPHQPFIQPEPFDEGLELPRDVPGAGQDEECQAFSDLYDGAVAYVDACIGRFLDALRERGLYDKAAIGFVADHGEALWEHGRFGHGGPDLFDEVVRVPLIVKPPAETFEAGRVVTANVSGFDVMPTLLELGGVQPPEGLDARSLVPLFRGTAEGLDRVVVTETSLRGLAIVEGSTKYVLEPGGQVEALYDLSSDPGESEDVGQEHPDRMDHMRGLAIAYLLEHRPGNYLLVHSGEEPASIRIGTRAVRTLVGAPVQEATEDGQSLVQIPARTWTLLQVEDPDADRVSVSGLAARGPATGFQPWVAGTLPSLSGAGVWCAHGPEAQAVPDSAPEPVDEELLEALRRLGYVE